MPMTYSDNMVLQREKPLRIAGTANAGEKVTVDIAGQKGEAVTAPDGKWSVTLPPMKAGGPYTLSISAASGKLDYTNVLIGEVWLCSGQSNMAFQVSSAVDSQAEGFSGICRPETANPSFRYEASVGDKCGGMGHFDTGLP